MPLNFIDGDFLDSTEKYAFVLCNCIETATNQQLEPRVSAVYEKFPHTNIYKDRKTTGKKGKPGSIEIKGNGTSERFFINIMSQFYAGTNNFPNDNSQKRQQWFKKALDQIADLNHLDSIVIDAQMIEDMIVKKGNDDVKELQTYIEIIDDFDKTLQLKCQSPVNISVYNSKFKPSNEIVNKRIAIKKIAPIAPVEPQKNPIEPPKNSVPTIPKCNAILLTNLDESMVLSLDNFRHLNIVKAFDTVAVDNTTEVVGLATQDKADAVVIKSDDLISKLPEAIEGWHNIFIDATVQKELLNIDKDFTKITEFYPPKDLIFNAFRQTPFSQIKVVILGQDCYHGYGEAMGLSFSVPVGVKVPPSLLNIYKELSTDIPGFKAPNHGDLTSWAKQGVLLLNSALTVQPKTAGSHLKVWTKFTDRIIELISQKATHPIIFMLWGLPAKKKQNLIDTKRHIILEASHPSPLSAPKGGWFGAKHFSTANEKLKEMKLEPINFLNV